MPLHMFLLALYVTGCLGAVRSQYDVLYDHIFSSYNPNTIPVLQHEDTVNVSLDLHVVSINDFDQLSGQLSMTTLVYISWYERRMSWNVTDFYNISSMRVTTKLLWYPRIYIMQTYVDVQELGGSTSSLATIENDGHVTWTLGFLMKITCSLDVTNFPFDTQTCRVSLSVASSIFRDIHMFSVSDHIQTSFYNDNSQWELLHSPITNSSDLTIRLDIRLKRRTVFYTVYIILPILLLGLLNNLVFILPTGSGERMSVAITIFLSFVVYMDIVNDNVPESSSPMANLYYYLLFLMFYSAGVMFLTIVSMRLYGKETEVPRNVRSYVRCLRFWATNGRRIHAVEASKTAGDTETKVDDNKSEELSGETDICTYNGVITWKEVSETFDAYSLVIVLAVFVVVTLATFLNLEFGQHE